jgi:opacity protein-like surface antigen
MISIMVKEAFLAAAAAVTIAGSAAPNTAQAQQQDPVTVEQTVDPKKPAPEKGQLSAVFSVASHHFGWRQFYDNGEKRTFNEINPGVGLEYRINDTFHVEAGAYKNSLYRTSVYASVAAETKGSRFLGAGLQAGVLTGYDMKLPVAAIPYLRFGSRDDKVNVKLNIIPPIPKITPATIGAQVRVKF